MDPTPLTGGRDLLPSIGLILGAFFVAYVYFAICLQLLARRTGTPGGWKAWVPLVNLGLMARIGGRSVVWAVLCLVPLLGLIPLVMIWAGIARARGKSGILGVLIIVPLLNLLLPLILLAGGNTANLATAAATTPAPGPPRCSACCASYSSGERYCGDCGQSVAIDQMRPASENPATAAVAAPSGSRAGLWIAAVFLLALIGAGAYLATGQRGVSVTGGGNGSAQRPTAVLPTRLSGVLREFPADNAASVARPTSVVSQNLRVKDSSATIPLSWFPKGIEPRRFAPVPPTLTSARYQEGVSGPAVWPAAARTSAAAQCTRSSERTL